MKLYHKIFLTLATTLILLTIIFVISDIFTIVTIDEKLQNSIDILSDTTSEESQKIIKNIATSSIRETAEIVATHMDVYLKQHPDKTLANLKYDENFRQLTIQPLQETGYTALLDLTNLKIFIHKYKQFEGIWISSLKKGNPNLYRIMMNVSYNFPAKGIYNWTDPDGVTKEKYAHIVNLKNKTSDNIQLAVISTAYLDEYTQPMQEIDKKIHLTGEKTKQFIKQITYDIGSKTIAIIIICMVLLFFLYALIMKKLMAPIYELVKITENMSTGNFNIRSQNFKKDEIGQLAKSFNRMANFIEERDLSLRQANEQLEKRVDLRTLELKEANLKIQQANEKLEDRVKQRTNELVVALEAQKASEETFRALTENSEDTIMRFNRKMQHLYTNSAVKKITGMEREKFIGKTHHELGFPKHLTSLWEEAISYTFDTGEKNRVEFYLDDLSIWIDWLLFPEFDEKGNVRAVITSARDITELKATEEALRNSEKLLSTTLNSVMEAVITTDIYKSVTFMNPPAEFLTGYSFEEAKDNLLGDIFTIIDEADRNRFIGCPVDQILEKKKSIDFSGNIAIVSKNNEELPITLNASPIIDDNNDLTGVVLVFRDVTVSRYQEAQLRNQQKLESLGTLSSGVAHEINNPIGIIMNFGELILEEADKDSQIAEDAQQIIKESTRIATIVKNLLSFSRHEKESRSIANMEDIIDNTLSLTSKLLKKDQVIIEKQIFGILPPVYCNSQEIMQVYMNLITNAKDALNDRYPGYDENKKIIINCEQIEKDGVKYLHTSFKDMGSGIPEELQQRIFDPFFTSKGRDKGTGLGLSISYGIVQEHNGEMYLKSKPGSGTNFYVDIPIYEQGDTENFTS